MKMEFSFFITNMAAVTSRKKQQYGTEKLT